ncbi:Uncharacterized protein PA52Ts2_0116 [Pseudomonas aeruginosa]|nr:tetR family transcriptional regulator-like protein [Pseudomonas aeruginosa]QJE75077.1 Uncharacterized protein PA52Ts1_0116 [Pseudomonas aeruginosa]QJE81522.1 Uncharacterized protein PA52Ts2_0116 [Pseudomonas aeruginosa]QJE87907.1 Uncharacterized protein PA52Ts17_0114 [Pseudomonas aeruginosa]QLJ86019.1 Uncharacterized protein PA52Ts32_0120 [Pseudomonas aeruginosa]
MRAENAQLSQDLARLASVNQTLILELAQLKGVATGKVVLLSSKPAS